MRIRIENGVNIPSEATDYCPHWPSLSGIASYWTRSLPIKKPPPYYLNWLKQVYPIATLLSNTNTNLEQ